MDSVNFKWFQEKVSRNPDYISERYLPALESCWGRAQVKRDRANRSGGIGEIKYAQGLLDGIDEIIQIFGGLRLSESGNPLASGSQKRNAATRRK